MYASPPFPFRNNIMVRLLLENGATIQGHTVELATVRTYSGPLDITFDSFVIVDGLDETPYFSGTVYAPATGDPFLADSRTPEFYQALDILFPLVIIAAIRFIFR